MVLQWVAGETINFGLTVQEGGCRPRRGFALLVNIIGGWGQVNTILTH